jgi:hypothetical protein
VGRTPQAEELPFNRFGLLKIPKRFLAGPFPSPLNPYMNLGPRGLFVDPPKVFGKPEDVPSIS